MDNQNRPGNIPVTPQPFTPPQQNNIQSHEKNNEPKLHKFIHTFGILYWVFVLIFVLFTAYTVILSQKPDNGDAGFALILPGYIYLLLSIIYSVLLIVMAVSKKSTLHQKKNAGLLMLAVVAPYLIFTAYALLSSGS